MTAFAWCGRRSSCPTTRRRPPARSRPARPDDAAGERAGGAGRGRAPRAGARAGRGELRRAHVPSFLEAAASGAGEGRRPGARARHRRQPDLRGHARGERLVCGGSTRWRRARSRRAGRDRAVNIAGGLHHAMADRAAGFCVYNDCAIAIAWLLDHGFERIAYVDVDVHHGDGVQAAFYDDPRVLTISLHQHPLTLWPGTGWPAEYGEGAAAGYAVNLRAAARAPRTRAGCGRSTRSCRRCSRAFRPQVLVTQCGADTHREDPLARPAAVRRRAPGRLPASCASSPTSTRAGRWLAIGGGGYGAVPGGPAVVDAPARRRCSTGTSTRARRYRAVRSAGRTAHRAASCRRR